MAIPLKNGKGELPGVEFLKKVKILE